MKTVCMPGISLKITFLLFTAGFFLSCQSQTSKHNDPKPARKDLAGMAVAANEFLNTLSEKQKDKIYFDLMRMNAITGILFRRTGKEFHWEN